MKSNPEQKPPANRRGFDWQLVTFFALAYLIAWALVPVLNNIARASDLTPSELLEAVENGQWAEISEDLVEPAWLVFLLTRIQDFAFTIAGVIVALAFGGRQGLRRLGDKMRLNRSEPRWYAAALLIPMVIYTVAAIIALATNSSIDDTMDLSAESLLAVIISPGAGILFYLFFRAGLGEEPGLRGVALDHEQARRGPLLASLIIGVLWAGWHAPLLIDQDPVTIVFFTIYTIALSFLFTWLFNTANKAVWVVALLHAAINAGDNAYEIIIPGLEGTDWQLPALLIFILVSIGAAVAIWRSQGDGAAGREIAEAN